MGIEVVDGNHPFLPRVGELIAICLHEPRRWCLHLIAEDQKLILSGITFSWLEICERCGEHRHDIHGLKKLRLNPHVWTEEDMARALRAN